MQDIVHELRWRFTVFTGEYGNWYRGLDAYLNAVSSAVSEDYKFREINRLKDDGPVLSTRKSLQAAAEQHKPVNIFLDMEMAIRMEFFDFKKKWDAVLPSRGAEF